jgi:HlyD family secretion protein
MLYFSSSVFLLLPKNTNAQQNLQNLQNLALIPLFFLGILFSISGCDLLTSSKEPPKKGTPPEISFPVIAGTISEGPITETAFLVGAVSYAKRIQLKSEIQGRVITSPYLPGDSFHSKDILIRIEDKDYQAELKRLEAERSKSEKVFTKLKVGTRIEILERLKAEIRQREAQLAQADEELRRAQALVQNKIIKQEEYTRANNLFQETQALLEQTKARYQEAENGAIPEELQIAEADIQIQESSILLTRLNIERCTLKAPFSGKVLQKYTEANSYVQKGDSLLEIVASSELELLLEIPERFVRLVQEKTSFSFTVDAFPGESFQGEVITLIPLADAQSRNVQLRAKILNAPEKLFQGMFVRAELPLAHREKTLLVSHDAITYKESQTVVFLLEQDRVRPIPVQVGLKNKTFIEIQGEGLQVGQNVILTGGEVLFPGAKVTVVSTSSTPH